MPSLFFPPCLFARHLPRNAKKKKKNPQFTSATTVQCYLDAIDAGVPLPQASGAFEPPSHEQLSSPFDEPSSFFRAVTAPFVDAAALGVHGEPEPEDDDGGGGDDDDDDESGDDGGGDDFGSGAGGDYPSDESGEEGDYDDDDDDDDYEGDETEEEEEEEEEEDPLAAAIAAARRSRQLFPPQVG